MINTTEIQKIKIERTLKQLEGVEGNGTSLITIMISQGGNINLMKHKLNNEYNSASQIQSRL